MCNACGFLCCAYDGFRGCGCDDCEEDECWTRCEFCNRIKNHISDECICDKGDDYDFGSDFDEDGKYVGEVLS